MARFAFYYIPDKTSKLYTLGSKILGYDIRSNKVIPQDSIAGASEDEMRDYAKFAYMYGFHMTITDAIEFDITRIADIEKEIGEVLACFSKDSEFKIIRVEDSLLMSPDHDDSIMLLGFKPNLALQTLHTLMVSRLHPMGTGSLYTHFLKVKPQYFEGKQNRITKVKKFFTPTAFDEYFPHLTLLNPYSGNHRDKVVSQLADLFDKEVPGEITLNKFYLVVEESQGEPFKIVREFIHPN